MWPLIVLTDDRKYTLPVALANLVGEHAQDIELMMAGSVLTVLPVLLLFLVLQRTYVRGDHARRDQGVRERGRRSGSGLSVQPSTGRARVRWRCWSRRRRGADEGARRLRDASRAWTAAPSEGVTLAVVAGCRSGGPAHAPGLRLPGARRLGGGARRPFDIELPGELRVHLPRSAARRRARRSSSSSWIARGENVWWSVRRDFDFPRDWQTLRIKKRQISFAWGPQAAAS